MKNIFIGIISLCSAIVFGQIKIQSDVEKNIVRENPFLDASGYTKESNNNLGKGLYFPRTDLTQWEFKTSAISRFNFMTAFDGMIVYNTGSGNVGQNVTTGYNAETQGLQVAVKPGFYYFSNPNGRRTRKVEEGQWIKIADTKDLEAGVNSGKFWSLSGNAGITPVQLQDKDGGDYTITNLNEANFIGSTDAKNVTMATKSIARLEVGENNYSVGGAAFEFVLDVYGKARFRKGIVTEASTYPDYVFDSYFTGKSDVNPDYKFKKLNEVEAFIKENNHLPGVTKIDDLAKTESGYEVDNTKLSIQTLEKVEELYLHLIEQQKEIQALKAQIAELKK